MTCGMTSPTRQERQAGHLKKWRTILALPPTRGLFQLSGERSLLDKSVPVHHALGRNTSREGCTSGNGSKECKEQSRRDAEQTRHHEIGEVLTPAAPLLRAANPASGN